MNSTLRRTRLRLFAGATGAVAVFARHRADRGDQVGLRLDPEGCHLFPATGDSNPQVLTPATV